MVYRISPLILIVFFLSCLHKQQQVKAKIFERKEIDNNRLLLKYKYQSGATTYIDSVTVRNFVIANDSINIIIDPDKPQRSLPDFTGAR
jgi:hypothetical protein